MIETQTPAPVETVTPIKPSEALRLGRLIRPYEPDEYETLFGGSDRACALGAIAIGYGFDPDKQESESDAYAYVANRTGWTFDNGDDGTLRAVWGRFDRAKAAGKSGDAAILAYLESRGL